MARRTPAEEIGVGKLLSDSFDPSSDLPSHLPSGLAVGQHLRIERLIRVQESRMTYLVNNIGPKWRMRKCWSCGNKYSPTSAQACTYCGAPLLDQQFLMTQRWDAREFEAWNSWLHAKHRDPLILSPVAMVFRKQQMLSVYHYDGARFLIDLPSPIPRRLLYAIATQLAHALNFLHSTGARLGEFSANNVLLMPDNSARVFDLNVVEHLSPRALLVHPDDPVRIDGSRLARILLGFISPTDAPIRRFLWDAAHERYPGPIPLIQELKRELVRTRPPRWAPKSAAMSDSGIVRARNEDRWMWYAMDESSCLFVCADGMGGHVDGHLAADLAVREIASHVIDNPNKVKDWSALLTSSLKSANAALLKRRGQDNRVLATTVIAALIGPRQATIVHAGDCRAYVLTPGSLNQITEDHTIIAELIASGRVTAAEAKTHPSRNVVTSGVGLEESFEIGAKTVKLNPGERLLFCSDGLCSFVEHREIETTLRDAETVSDAVTVLTKLALANGSTDNITVMAAEIP